MKVVGLTGGIGSGKTTILKCFKAFDIPVYIADDEAKALMNRSKVIKRKLIQLFGESAYKHDKLNRPYLASKIFNDKSLLSKMNAIVHPKVASHFKRWLKKQDAPYIIKEAAIIFENNLENQYDYIITVIADKDLRIKRVMQRDNASKEKIQSIINNQLSDDEKVKRSDFVIVNNDLETAKAQAKDIHQQLLRLLNC
ncbi:dephospho-CoA kinase [Winogradskyella echinorum]|uniref:Dephospho-CoA kinase n=1 Tax=Winogradskyella echinorum TaxID=538189 RepID=A0ABR6Y5I1_9FLAO|nr:dephospho-CoA kinase [Winogradskyella echinorum]MBC3848019.1 dephospho-CoA kinase [Winogradskyella echinorum]MBC5752367.1 dephospho-CoA kinase [Winogradskyella echinorum]